MVEQAESAGALSVAAMEVLVKAGADARVMAALPAEQVGQVVMAGSWALGQAVHWLAPEVEETEPGVQGWQALLPAVLK